MSFANSLKAFSPSTRAKSRNVVAILSILNTALIGDTPVYNKERCYRTGFGTLVGVRTAFAFKTFEKRLSLNELDSLLSCFESIRGSVSERIGGKTSSISLNVKPEEVLSFVVMPIMDGLSNAAKQLYESTAEKPRCLQQDIFDNFQSKMERALR
ncbi:hypothetical protein TWF481_002828 [Arthrobotrys musiformis]|uniref:Uncharacterized protein n=1 Tax=Arthrobotrys musiformis TaxID=47236 RepID=A0AAV9VSK9_9PEZI